MNRLKRFCALLLAVVLTFGAVLPLGVGGVYAENMEQTEQIAELAALSAAAPAEALFTDTITEPDPDSITESFTDSSTGPVTESKTKPAVTTAAEPATNPTKKPAATTAAEPATNPTKKPAAAPAVEFVTDSTTKPVAEPVAELVTGSTTKLAAEPITEFETDPITEPVADPTMEFETDSVTGAVADSTTEFETDPVTESADQTTGGETDPITDHVADQVTEPDTEIFADSTTDPDADLITEPGTDEELLVVSFYEQLMACSSLADFDALMRADENTAALDALTQDELKQLLARVEEIYAGIDQPTEADTLLKEELLKKLNEHILVTCPECGETDGHAETCSQYESESVSYPWAELTDPELASWLMDEANADTVKAILTSDNEESAALNLRIEAILGAEDLELALQLQEYLSALLELDEQMFTDGAADEYIYFDLAAGNVTIGKKKYSGYVYVEGKKESVTGDHKSENKYYVYQSTVANQSETGYSTETDYKGKTGCRIPTYTRVQNEGKLWGDYVTNNTDVKAVSTAWATAAAASKRTGTSNNITFTAGSTYDVTIDNIWSTKQVKGNTRNTGGIAAHLNYERNTTIQLRLKGDNRVGNIHYGAREGTNNRIIFSNGADPGDTSGSITVADFPNDLGLNYWGSAIGGDDSQCDSSDGIVIESGVIYAGTTSKDDCTAIGGGGNNFGGVTISGGTVTAVSASTGTAIGGGIGWGNRGGDADVLISGGTVYAYNYGIGSDSGSYTSFVPAAAIGGGSADKNTGNERTTVTITGGTVYAQSVGGAAIGGGGSGTSTGGKATVNIEGGTVIAKSIGKEVNYNKENNTNHREQVAAGVSIGGGTGKTGGGSVTLNVSGENTILRTGSIGGGKTTGNGNIGSANVKITGGDITGQVIMASGAAKNCTFDMSGGKIHGTNVIDGNIIADIKPVIDDPNPEAKIEYLYKDGGAVWMQDPEGVTKIIGGTIEECHAYLGGAIYMNGGTFTLSDNGTIQNNTSLRGDSDKLQGYGGGVYIIGGSAEIKGGSINDNGAQIRGGGLYVNGGNVTVSDGSISNNTAGFGENLPTEVGRGGGVYLEGGLFTMTGGNIVGNHAKYRGGGIFLTKTPILNGGEISGNTAVDSGGGLCVNGDKVELENPGMRIFSNKAKNGGGVAVLNGSFILNGGNVGVEPTASEGTEVPNTANENRASEKGGGVYVANDVGTSTSDSGAASVTIKSGNIWHNFSEQSGGGVYLESGDFTMKGENSFIRNNSANQNGGGVYLKSGNFTMEGEHSFIENNSAKQDGGGVYLESGNFILNGMGASIKDNKADRNGGGIYLHTAPNLLQGIIEDNTAKVDGGGMYISDCLVTLNPTGNVTITKNTAQNGAGIYISGDSGSSESTVSFVSDVDAVSSATLEHKVGLHVGEKPYNGELIFTNNTATDSGGAVCVSAGRFQLDSSNITVTGNTAVNGGGVAVLHGNFTMTDGSIGEHNGANNATKGGGVYVSDGEVWLKGGSVQYNTATDGGGAYVIGATSDIGGNFVMINGSLTNNTATGNGGGAYVAGDFHMLDGTVDGNGATNGGGVYVNDGDVTVVYGIISNNSAKQDGGGFYVSATDKEVKVVMLSGSLSSNQANANGGGMAVESSSTTRISVDIGCLRNHNIQAGHPSYPVLYEGDYHSYANYYGEECKHNSCPEVKENKAGNIGGGFYLKSDSSILSFFCVEESGNTAAKGKENSEGMDVEGGKVIIGDEEYHNHDKNGNELGVPRGYISMDNATIVNGGQVDIYGDMTNPIFRDEVTVDIENTEHDHFMDHRHVHNNEKSYKVHYIENFFGTGLYQAFQYDEGNTVITIEGALYSHPGYKILGWYTKAKYDPTVEDHENQFYPVGERYDLSNPKDVPQMGTHSINCEICGIDSKDSNLLELYAIWEAYGYTVIFDPNVPKGDTYTGSMENQIHQYGVEQELTKNAYQYSGHFFNGWNTKADGSGTPYTDGQKVSNLTDKNGVKVVLYAQWEPCKHDVPERWSYDVIDDGKTLRRICSCGGQTLTATLSAEDTTYDGDTHAATLTLDDKEAWGDDAPTVTYTGEWINVVHTGMTGDSPLGQDSIPRHAGVYTASITKPDEKSAGCPQTNKVTASVEYTIDKADQSAPAKPTYTVTDNQLIVKKVAEDPHNLVAGGIIQTAKAQYRLNYYSGSDLTPTEWESIPDGSDELPIIMGNAWTSYNVEARYEELNDYYASDITRADAVYHYEGNVTVKIICDEGIEYCFDATLTDEKKFNGATLTLETLDGYYIVSGKYSVKKTLDENEEEVVEPDEHGVYSFTSISDGSTLTIIIGTAKKKPQVKAQVAPKQVFSSFKDTKTTISRDSAFTAAFQIDNFDPEVYETPKLTFAQGIPNGTTIILLNRGKNEAKTYWYYRVKSENVTSVPLTSFTKMGGTGYYSVSQPGNANDYIDLNYQFIVDFSQSSDGYSGVGLNMTLEAPVNNGDTGAPTINSPVSVSMKDSSFLLKKEDKPEGANDLTNRLTYTFDVTDGAAASKWEKRASALVLTPNTGTNLPPDAQIKAQVAGGGTTYLYKNATSFIVPLSLLQTGEKTVTLTLQSALFPKEEASYSFTAEWLISPSKAGKAPLAGDSAGKISEVTFVSAAKEDPSLKPIGQFRILTAQDRLKLNITTKNLDNYTVSAALLRKSGNGTYNGTGWNQANVKAGTLNVPLGSCTPGSYCVMFTVKEANSVTIVMEVPYYFIVKQTQ